MNIELKIDGAVVYSNTTPTVPPVTPPTASPPATSPAGMWPLNEVQVWPLLERLRGSLISVSFVADAGRYLNGVRIQAIDEDNDNDKLSRPKDYVISESPGSFEPVGGNPLGARYGAGTTMGPIECRFGPVRPRSFFGWSLPTEDLPLTPGRTYYINVRAHDGSGAMVSTQFLCYARKD